MGASDVIGECDVTIVGGGIVGLATAVRLLQSRPSTRVIVLEAETDVGLHQSGRNSGVLHSGAYYKPGSLKAITCRTGKAMMEAFCAANEVPTERCGKVIVATGAQEVQRLDAIQERAAANGVECRRIDSDELRKLEPAAAGC